MPNIVAARIDNRLVHGQIVNHWAKATGANLILVANDEASKDRFRQGLMNMVIPVNASVRYFDLDTTIELIGQASEEQKIFLIVETTDDALKLVENGVPVEAFNVGNLAWKRGKKIVTSSVALDDTDFENLDQMQSLGTKVFFQQTPQSESIDFDQVLQRESKSSSPLQPV